MLMKNCMLMTWEKLFRNILAVSVFLLIISCNDSSNIKTNDGYFVVCVAQGFIKNNGSLGPGHIVVVIPSPDGNLVNGGCLLIDLTIKLIEDNHKNISTNFVL